MRCKLPLLTAAALLSLNPTPAWAWDEFGHVVVARIAWENMTPQARTRAIQILRAAPPNSGLGRGFGVGSLSPQQQVRLFVSAGHWPDDIRNPNHPGHSFDRGNRHFVNLFWIQNTDFGTIRPSNRPPFGDLLSDMPGLRRALTGPNQGDAAVSLAWIIHLVGDIHQPLHSSSRITPLDEDGDRGGNDFRLAGSSRNLHSYWDGVITRNHPPRQGESDDNYLLRVASDIASRNPRSQFQAALAITDVTAWARESLDLAQTRTYRPPLRRNQQPPVAYNRSALAAAEPRAALAGYRLAAMLNGALGS